MKMYSFAIIDEKSPDKKKQKSIHFTNMTFFVVLYYIKYFMYLFIKNIYGIFCCCQLSVICQFVALILDLYDS